MLSDWHIYLSSLWDFKNCAKNTEPPGCVHTDKSSHMQSAVHIEANCTASKMLIHTCKTFLLKDHQHNSQSGGLFLRFMYDSLLGVKKSRVKRHYITTIWDTFRLRQCCITTTHGVQMCQIISEITVSL